MKLKILSLIIVTGIIVSSCCKEDTPQNQQEQKLTTKDLKFLPYQVGDTLHFKQIYNDGVQDGYCEDTVEYYVVSKEQTSNKLIVKCRIEHTNENAHFELTKNGDIPVVQVDYYDFNSYDSTETGLDLSIGGFNLQHYNEMTLDSITYQDVYMNESDTSLNSQHCMYIRKLYYNKTYGIIRVEKECYAYNIY